MRLKCAWEQGLCHVLLLASLPCRDAGLLACQDSLSGLRTISRWVSSRNLYRIQASLEYEKSMKKHWNDVKNPWNDRAKPVNSHQKLGPKFVIHFLFQIDNRRVFLGWSGSAASTWPPRFKSGCLLIAHKSMLGPIIGTKSALMAGVAEAVSVWDLVAKPKVH